MTTERRPLPTSEFENRLLGGIIESNGAALDDVLPVLHDGAAFMEPDHREIWSAMLSFHSDGLEFDIPLLVGRLTKIGNPTCCDCWRTIVDSCWASAPEGCVNSARYAELVRQSHDRRRLIRVGQTIANRAYNESLSEPDAIAHDAADAIEGILASKSAAETVDAAELIDDLERSLRDPRGSFIPTQIAPIDGRISGFAKGEQIVIAARPSVGKTALGVTIAYTVSHTAPSDGGCPVAFFSVEMRQNKIMARLAALVSGVSAFDLLTGRAEEEERALALKALREYVDPGKLFIVDDAVNVRDIVSRARSLHRRHGVELVFVDYLQLCEPAGKYENRNLAVASMSAALKRLAVESNIAVVVFSQLNRASAKEKKMPLLSELRDSGAIEQDADLIAFLHRPDPEEKRRVIFHVAKHRNGPTGDCDLRFDPRVMRFTGEDQTPF